VFEIFLAISMFTGASMAALVLVILAARRQAGSSGDVSIEINGEKNHCGAGRRQGAANPGGQQYLPSSACGGGELPAPSARSVWSSTAVAKCCRRPIFTRHDQRPAGACLAGPGQQDMKIQECRREVFGVKKLGMYGQPIRT
jgi:Na+-transporting NADH:ubiquinone oxidoreductase subunit F